MCEGMKHITLPVSTNAEASLWEAVTLLVLVKINTFAPLLKALCGALPFGLHACLCKPDLLLCIMAKLSTLKAAAVTHFGLDMLAQLSVCLMSHHRRGLVLCDV